MRKKYAVFLSILFVCVLAIRLFFALQTPYFSEEDAYFTLRQVENIKETGTPLFEDPLSYGGREYAFLPLFHYVLAAFSLFIPAMLALKIIPNLLASALIFPVFMLINLITRKENISFLGALIASFIPVFVFETVNSASVYTFSLPLIVLLMYYFIRINTTKDPKWFIIFYIILLLTDPSAIFLVLATLLYLLFTWTEGLDVKRGEIELATFSLLLSVLFYIFFFREALMMHGPSIIFGNLPAGVMNNYFSSLQFSQTLISIGIIPLLSAIFVSFLYLGKKKKKSVYLPMSFTFIITLMLVFRLVPVVLGLMYLGIMCTILFGEFFDYLIKYFKKTKFSKLKWSVYVILLLIVLITSFFPSLLGAKQVTSEPEFHETITLLNLLPGISDKDIKVASVPENGHFITYFAERKNVADSNYLYINDANQRVTALRNLYTSAVASRSLEIMKKYSIDYILLDNRAREKYNITRLSYVNEECFPLILSYNETKIYKKTCSLV